MDIGKEVAKFNYVIAGNELSFTINQIKGDYRLNVVGANKYLFTLDSVDIQHAKREIDNIVNTFGVDRFLNTINLNKKEVELSKNNTDWEVYSEYSTPRGNTAFKIYRRINKNRYEWKQESKCKVYLSIHMTSKEDDVNREIIEVVQKKKLKYVSGVKF